MAKKKHFSEIPSGKKSGKNRLSAPPPSENSDDDALAEDVGLRRTFSDVYLVGREIRPNSGGKRPEKVPSARILSSREFLEEYQKNRPASNKSSAGERKSRPEREKKLDPKRGKNVGSEPGTRGKSVGLRIIGGKFRAVRLEYGGDHRVRPMKDRIRESMFNLMGTLAEGRYAVDLFAGTGALAFEALSRGAAGATLVEIHFPTARIIQKNIAALAAQDPTIASRIRLLTTDVFFWTQNLAGSLGGASSMGVPSTSAPSMGAPSTDFLPTDRPWLVFCSPPYDFYVERADDMLALLNRLRSVAPPDSVFIVEADNRFDFGLLGVEIPPKKRKSYPPAELGIFTI